MLVRYRFQEFEFSPIERELYRKGNRVELPATVLAMLAHLIENRHRVVSREELAKAAWPDRFVADHTLTARLSDLRRALTTGKRPHPLRTVYGEGVRFVGDVRLDNPRITLADRAEEAAGQKDQAKGRPTIAVLPFKQASGSPEQLAVSDALPDDIISELTNLRWLFVIARGSTFRFPSYEHSLADIGRELQVRYCLSGEVRAEGDKLRFSVELAETVGETILWRDSFMTKIAGAHELRQEIVSRIASELDRRITDHEIAQARLKNPSSLDAWGVYHSGLAKVLGHNTQNLDGALADFSRCIEFDPRFARGYTGLVHTRWLRTLQLDLDQKAAELAGMITAAIHIHPSQKYLRRIKAVVVILKVGFCLELKSCAGNPIRISNLELYPLASDSCIVPAPATRSLPLSALCLHTPIGSGLGLRIRASPSLSEIRCPCEF